VREDFVVSTSGHRINDLEDKRASVTIRERSRTRKPWRQPTFFGPRGGWVITLSVLTLAASIAYSNPDKRRYYNSRMCSCADVNEEKPKTQFLLPICKKGFGQDKRLSCSHGALKLQVAPR